MKKSTKGALAAAAAAVLLLGGAGTLAYWTADATLDGGSVTAGEITLTDVQCASSWTHDDAGGTEAVTTIVPGDTITKQCTGTLTLVGDHIGATVDLSDAGVTGTGELDEALEVSATMTSPAATITDPGTYDVVVDIDVEFPYDGPVSTDPTTDADNTTQLDTATLDELTLVAVQTHP
ncbi:MAG: alternate-type signal peptide domain-containing protein [Aeromicrobium sp.]|uniref:alternate-type signal peptide domain-containing protein n=1 Tax=Aeromicrobium sp. TaxID=1871063 RepID=UPI0039E230EC